MKKVEIIFVVIEQGSGIIHKAFKKYSDMLDYIEELKKETGFDCYEFHELEYVY